MGTTLTVTAPKPGADHPIQTRMASSESICPECLDPIHPGQIVHRMASGRIVHAGACAP